MSQLPDRKNPQSNGAGRRWILYGVNPEERRLLVQCLETLQLGMVVPEDSRDWVLGCNAIQHPDVWSAPSRVQPTGVVASLPYVVEDHYGHDCGCVECNRRTRFHPIPAEMLDGSWFPWLGSRSLTKTLAEFGPFCSNQLALAFQVLQIEVDDDQATSWVLDRLSATRDRGVHIPACVILSCLNLGVVESLRAERQVWRWDPATNDWQRQSGAVATSHDDDDRGDDDYGGGGDDDDDDDDDDDPGDDDGDRDDGDPGSDAGDTSGGDLLEAQAYAEYLESQRADWQGRQYATFE